MESLDWTIVIIAGASLIFAAIAMKMVRDTTQRIDSYLDKVPKDLGKIVSPSFLAETVIEVITKGLKHPDGSPVSVPDVIDGYAMKYGPVLMAHFDKNKAEYIPLLLQGSTQPPQGGQTPGQALAAQRWGGGLKAAQTVGKAASKVGLGEKISGLVETVGAVAQVAPMIKDLRETFGGGNGNTPSGGGGASPSTAPDDVWVPQ